MAALARTHAFTRDRDGSVSLACHFIPESKLLIPPLPVPWIERGRLDVRLSTATRGRLTVVAAAAGSGKTVAVSAWAQRCERGVVWVSPDRRENELGAFWATLEKALSNATDRAAATAGDEATPPGLETIVRLCEQLPPSTLVFDDFHVLRARGVLAGTRDLLRYLPPHVTVVLVTRREPDLALEKLRLEGELTRLSDDDLRFSIEEAGALIHAVADQDVCQDDVSCLLTRTEGWATGLRLAAAHLQGRRALGSAVQELTEGVTWIERYFAEEVLEQVPPDRVRFLLATSIASEVDRSLCDALVVGVRADHNLVGILEDHEFATSPRPGVVRYNQLFAESLRGLFRQRDPCALADAHRRAGEYFERHGSLSLALRHFEAAEDFDRALALVAGSAVEHLAAGDVHGDRAKLSILAPDWYFAAEPLRMLAHVLCLLAAGERWQARHWLQRLTWSVSGSALKAWYAPRAEVLLAFLDWIALDLRAAEQHAKRALSLGPDGAGTPDVPSELWVAPWRVHFDQLVVPLASLLLARAHAGLGDDAAAETVLADAQVRLHELSGLADISAFRAAILARQGRLCEASRVAMAVLDGRHASAEESSGQLVEAEVALATVHLERGRPRDALDLLEVATARARHWNDDARLMLLELERVPALLALGHEEDVRELLERLVRRCGTVAVPSAVQDALEAADARLCLAVGDLDAATADVRRLPRTAASSLLAARVDLAAGRPERALGRLTTKAMTELAPLLRIEQLSLIARASYQVGLVPRARDAMHRALDLGRAEGIVYPFVGRASDVRWIVESLVGGHPDPYIAAVLSSCGGTEPASGVRDAEVGSLIEGLTEREREALVRLPSHLTQKQIAADLYVSVNTLKTHLKSVYRKLGASSRSEAVAAARRRGLV